MGAGAWDEGGETGDAKSAGLPICTAGGCPEGVRHTDVPHEVDGVEHDMGGAVPEGVLESIHDLPAVIDREALVGRRRGGRCSGTGVRVSARTERRICIGDRP